MTDAQQSALLADPRLDPQPDRGELLIVVHGTVHGQGSKRIAGGRLLDANDKVLRPWRHAVRLAAEDALLAWPGDQVLPLHARGTPVAVAATFTFARPAGHYGTGRNAAALKPSAPTRPTTTPDLDKALRVVGDSLTDAGVVRDDAQIARITADKTYPGGHPDALDVPGAVIRVHPITGEEVTP